MLLRHGTNVSFKFVKEGYCRWDRKYAPGNRKFEKLEQEARQGKKGLWAESNPVPPWEWRKKKK